MSELLASSSPPASPDENPWSNFKVSGELMTPGKQFHDEVNGLFANGGLGHRPLDLGEQPGDRPFDPEPPSPFKGRLGPMSDAEIAEVMAAGSPKTTTEQEPRDFRQGPGQRIIYHENSDGTMMTPEQLAANQAADDAERQAAGEPTWSEVSAAQRDAYYASKAEQDAADQALLDAMNPGLRAAGLEKYGHDGLLSILKGEQQLPHYTGPGLEADESGTFRHASTGESMTLADVKATEARAAEGRPHDYYETTPEQEPAARLDADTKQLGSDALAALQRGGDDRFTGQLSPDGKQLYEHVTIDGDHGFDAVYDTETGELRGVRVDIAETDPTTGQLEHHEVKVIEPGASTQIDGEPVTDPVIIDRVNELIKHTDEQIAQPEVTPAPVDHPPVDGAEQPVETVELTPKVTEPTVDQTPGTPPEVPLDAPVSESMRRPEFDETVARQSAQNFVSAYANNPNVRRQLEQFGVDFTAMAEQAKVGINVSPELIKQMQTLARDVQPKSTIWQEQPGRGSVLQQAAGESYQKLANILKQLY